MDSNGSDIRKTQQEREKTKMDSNGREIRKTQQEVEEMEKKTPEARLKIVKELVRKTREERKNMEHKTRAGDEDDEQSCSTYIGQISI